MQTNLEQMIESVRSLPFEDLEKLSEVINEEKQAKRAKEEVLQKELEDYAKAKKWIAENGKKYLNQWVCLDGDQLIAHGTDALEVHEKAKEAGIEIPYLEQIVEEEDWGGW